MATSNSRLIQSYVPCAVHGLGNLTSVRYLLFFNFKLLMEQFEKFLSLFFGQVSQLNFEKSRELVEREREMTRVGQLRQFISILPNFIEAEKSYFNLGFLSVKNKIFLRKDNSLRSMYESVKTELNRLEDVNWGDRALSTIVNQLCQYLTARVQLVDFCECEILRNLLSAQIEIELWNFIASLTHLHASHSQLNSWEKSLQSKETWKLGFGAGFLKGSQLPALYHWLAKFKSAIVSKFSLYFYHTLAQQSSHQDMRNHLANKHVTDYHHKLQNLQRRCIATSAFLVFETVGLLDWGGPSYLHPDRQKEPPDEDYVVMMSHPAKPIEQMARIKQILSERTADYILTDRVMCFYDTKENCTYFMSIVDPRVTLVVVFDSKKDDKEVTVVNYMNEFCAQVRCTKIFASLKVHNLRV
ncbi:hypothetical protein AAG570_002626 [Ranatra chinensis]|uniref:Uncharacterized protein n=1 Tax=Ranatra chinensis TaxID=642074 RepID=A0ABD0Y923_9HEMI